ncbi:MAG TPA: hypothetical protein VK528_12240 [Flavobacterium sp.]|nr:hypothetical protein [Flavobacterium sp.]
MIFYGTKARNIKNGKLRNVTCPECQTETTMTYSIFGKYAHVYWIPFFPIAKVTVIECDHCKKTFELKSLPETIKKKVEIEKDRDPVRTPVWFFSGTALVAVLICYGVYTSNRTEADEKIYIKNPKVGDVYSIKVDSNFYSTYKVAEVRKDTLYVFVNDMQTDKMTAIDKIDIPKNYKEQYAIARKAIEDLYKKEEIYEITRP